MPSIDVCFSPELLPLYDLKGKIAVAVDVLRATSSMVTALAHGVSHIAPVSDLQECLAFREKGYLVAAERDGIKADGFDFGNSPFHYREGVEGKRLAITTTNGTQAIRLSRAADEVLVGAFVNVGAVARYVRAKGKDVVVVCAGWKGLFNLEDTLFAGALAERLQADFHLNHDATLAAYHLYQTAKTDLLGFLSKSSHVQRLERLHILPDIEFCLQEDVYQLVPVLQGDVLVPAELG
ncbi:2-phosphosulfolactate phosphatase [Rufibacter quisquiliarum]|uniref:Probable 2-phosphosulfolactate phosphatase n=1 Tax=Rufibacter quisquiliarum TaxID=1549639 RepID=A0A839GFP0_9BACT|nr:2-phosphosulfolactate phosphatase [Rufibacter quisquiliarum]MBA9075489.1 2-phosphosulfolactate phosphatase [Rufibacter quisquiliarum]